MVVVPVVQALTEEDVIPVVEAVAPVAILALVVMEELLMVIMQEQLGLEVEPVAGLP
jgi:hypothetical protein